MATDKITYTTDHKRKHFRDRSEVPAKVLADQFDHLSAEDDNGFFNYRNYWYHLSDFIRADPTADDGSIFPTCPFRVDGYHSDSAFSGIVISICRDDTDTYMVATFYS